MTAPKLHISEKLSLPRETVTSTLVVYGGKGMGKTNLGAVIAEELDRVGLRYCVVDPMGVWWGLRHAKDGKGPGVECLILGGAHGDIPIEPTGGAVVADLVADEQANVIIDISRKPSGEAWGVGEKIRFVTDYGKRLFQRQGSLVDGKRREPIFQILDEAARFIPQMIRAGQPELAMCLSVWAQIVEEGRNHGMGVCLLTQRSARLAKDVAELADAMIAFRTVGPNSIGAITDWLGEHVAKERIKQTVEQVRSLPVGTCLVVSPGWLEFEQIVPIRARNTFDSSATPRPGERAHRVVGSGAKPDLAKYAERMKETIERAKESDPSALKKKVAELTADLARVHRNVHPASAASTKVDIGSAKRIRQLEADLRTLENARAKYHELQVQIQGHADRAQTAAKAASAALTEIARELRNLSTKTPPRLLVPAAATAPVAPAVTVTVGVRQKHGNDVSAKHSGELKGGGEAAAHTGHGESQPSLSIDAQLPSTAKKMLGVLASWAPRGMSRGQLAALVGVKASTGSYSNLLSALRTRNLISESSGLVFATDDGIALSGDVAPPPTSTDEVVQLWKPKLGKTPAAILDVLVAHSGEAIPRSEAAQAVGVKSDTGSFSNCLSMLRTAGLMVDVSPGMIAANRETLFL